MEIIKKLIDRDSATIVRDYLMTSREDVVKRHIKIMSQIKIYANWLEISRHNRGATFIIDDSISRNIMSIYGKIWHLHFSVMPKIQYQLDYNFGIQGTSRRDEFYGD